LFRPAFFVIMLRMRARDDATSIELHAHLQRRPLQIHPFEHGTVTASLGGAARPESITVPEERIGGTYHSVADATGSGGTRVAAL
jgi:hypothetical protein